MGLLDTWYCPNTNCWYDKNTGKEGEHCPECGAKLEKFGIRKSVTLTQEKEKNNPQSKEEREERKRKKEEDRIKKRRLFNRDTTDNELIEAIEDSQLDLANSEAGTGWMRAGTLLSMNTTEQMIGAGFKALINQQKIVIRQNEQILRELKKLNDKNVNNPESS